VGIGIDKKTGVITISVTAQDPLICKTIADSLTLHLQSFITDYRTNKARIDVEHYKKLVSASKNEYVRTRQQYGAYADSHTDVVLESYRAKLNDIENDMQLKFQAYSTFNTQLQAAMAKLQERTPAFTVVKGASVPTKPSGPKRMIFVAGMMLLVALLTAFYIYTINTKS
jgi:capsule polysaccharide export protein KpsE/RkpR